MKRTVYFVYGVASHLLFLLVFVFMIGFVGNLLVPVTIDAPGATFSWVALARDAALITLWWRS